MDAKTHLIIKQFLKDYTFTDSTTFHMMYADFDAKRLVPSFKRFVSILKEMGVKSKSYRDGDRVIRRFYYAPLLDQYLSKLHNLVTCPTCEGKGVIKQNI